MDTLIGLATFSSTFHQAWFIGSLTVLLLSCLGAWLGQRHIFHWLCLGHAVIAFEAVCETLFRSGENEAFSVHCIWFNALMAVVYFLLLGSPEVAVQLEADAKKRPEDNEVG
jgi:hypothetical protein